MRKLVYAFAFCFFSHPAVAVQNGNDDLAGIITPAGLTTGGPPPVSDDAPGFQATMGAMPPRQLDANDINKLTCNLHELKIPAPVKEALKNWDPDFVIWRSTEYSSLLCLDVATSPVLALNSGFADFNADKRMDVAVAGHSKKNEFIIAVMSQGATDYRVIQLCSSAVNGTSALPEAGGCELLGTGIYGLAASPRVALYKMLPKGTKINVFTGWSKPFISRLKSEAFLAGYINQDFIAHKGSYLNESGELKRHPLHGFQLFRWNLREEKNRDWIKFNKSRYDFFIWHIHAINDEDWEFSYHR